MRVLLDFATIVLFFAAAKFYNFYVGTAVLMAAITVQMGILYALDRKLSTMHKVAWVLVIVFGALTLTLHDERFLKWKPTVLYVAMALALAVALWGYRKNFLKSMLGSQLNLPDFAWQRLTVFWIAYFVFMAVLNAYVAVFFSTAAWVDFKLWGYVFPVAFLVAQGVYVARHMISTPEPGAADSGAGK